MCYHKSMSTQPDVTVKSHPSLTMPVRQLATIAMLIEGICKDNREQTRLALSRNGVLESALHNIKMALIRAGAEQHGIGWKPREPTSTAG